MLKFEFLRGDIFGGKVTEQNQLIFVFGHVGYNNMRGDVEAFLAKYLPSVNANEFFTDLSQGPLLYQSDPKRWIWPFYADMSGLSDDNLQSTLLTVLQWVARNGVTTVATNGVKAPNTPTIKDGAREFNHRRTGFLIETLHELATSVLGKDAEQLHLQLITKNDTFIEFGK